MKLGDVATVSRGITTGNRKLFVMTRPEARSRGLEKYVRPIVHSARELSQRGNAVVTDHPERLVVVIASVRDYEQDTALRKYLGDEPPRVRSGGSAPIAATYVGTPRFAENPDDLVVMNSLYRISPRQPMTREQIQKLVERLNHATSKLAQRRFAERWTPRQMEALEI